MFVKEPRNISYLISFSFHLVLALLFIFLKVSSSIKAEEYLLIGFGSGSGIGSPGGSVENKKMSEPKIISEKNVVKKNEKKIDLPKSKQIDDKNVITAVNKKNLDKEKDSNVKPLTSASKKNNVADQGGSGSGGFGFELDFGGKGMRRIYSYNLPEYPEGVSKEIDVKLRFTILPDGTVSKIFPVIKADARLELASINSLKNWRFEPLPKSAKQIDQTVVITFPYRLQ
jgi:protein TonB